MRDEGGKGGRGEKREEMREEGGKRGRGEKREERRERGGGDEREFWLRKQFILSGEVEGGR